MIVIESNKKILGHTAKVRIISNKPFIRYNQTVLTTE